MDYNLINKTNRQPTELKKYIFDFGYIQILLIKFGIIFVSSNHLNKIYLITYEKHINTIKKLYFIYYITNNENIIATLKFTILDNEDIHLKNFDVFIYIMNYMKSVDDCFKPKFIREHNISIIYECRKNKSYELIMKLSSLCTAIYNNISNSLTIYIKNQDGKIITKYSSIYNLKFEFIIKNIPYLIMINPIIYIKKQNNEVTKIFNTDRNYKLITHNKIASLYINDNLLFTGLLLNNFKSYKNGIHIIDGVELTVENGIIKSSSDINYPSFKKIIIVNNKILFDNNKYNLHFIYLFTNKFNLIRFINNIYVK